jgi:hypothetical protein
MAKPRPLNEDALFAVLDQLKFASDIYAFERFVPQLQRAFDINVDELTSEFKPRVNFNITGCAAAALSCLAKMLRPLSGAVVQGITAITEIISSDSASSSSSNNTSAAIEVLGRHTQAVNCIIRCCFALLVAMSSTRHMTEDSRQVAVTQAVLAHTSGEA